METRCQYPFILWALAVWCEFRGEPYQAKLAGAWVMRNRADDKARRWPRTIPEVILQPAQFSAFLKTDPNAVLLPAETDPSWVDSCRAIDDLIAGVADPAHGANHYHAIPAAHSGSWPEWAEAINQTAFIGNTRFYKL